MPREPNLLAASSDAREIARSAMAVLSTLSGQEIEQAGIPRPYIIHGDTFNTLYTLGLRWVALEAKGRKW